LSEKLIHLGGEERERAHAAHDDTLREDFDAGGARKQEKERSSVNIKMLACISARGKAKHSNTCFMTSKLVRSATPVKEEITLFSLCCCCFIFSIDAALRRKKSPLLKRHRFSPHAHRKYTRRWCVFLEGERRGAIILGRL
jgi:hypothetical protein